MSTLPCSNCRERHQKCDRRQPICKRCESKGLECRLPRRKPVFRHGSTANLDASFHQDQTWVNSRPRNWKASTRSSAAVRSESRIAMSLSSPQPEVSLPSPDQVSSDMGPSISPRGYGQNGAFDEFQSRQEDNVATAVSSYSPTALPISPPALQSCEASSNTHRSTNPGFCQDNRSTCADSHFTTQEDLSSTNHRSPSCHGNIGDLTADVQESCLLRYFIEELSPWFDHCDDRRQFQLVVPGRAVQCLALRNAIFAVSSRHLFRLPQYKTPHGIVYHGQTLSHLTHATSLEYMLKCIPELVQFPEIQDSRHQENIMAATVILRQYEEMEEEIEDGDEKSHANERVNFLAITQAIIDRMILTPLYHSLAAAAHWIAIRQEVYFAFTRQRCPQFRLDTDHWRNFSVANTMVVFASQVARWRWGMKTTEEWEPLKRQHQHLSEEFRSELQPILERKPDRARGEIFPTIWYCYDSQVTAIQHLKLGEMILIAESPHLENARGAVHRKAEAQVRSIVLSICGIALNHPRCQPAMVNAVISITLYGGYFTQSEDRDALLGIIHQTMELHSWPMRKPYHHILDQWEAVDNVEL